MHDAGSENRPAVGHVFLVEDDMAVRSSLALLLQLHGFVTREFASAEEFLAAAPPLDRPACALVDIRLPGLSGLDLQARMVRNRLAPPVLLMSAHGDESIAHAALLNGAVDFLEKPIDEETLLAAVSAGLRSDDARLVEDREKELLLRQMQLLTRHETALFHRITDGCPARAIAEEFGVTLEDFNRQRDDIQRKLGAPRVTDLFRLRFRLGDSVAMLDRGR